MTLGRSRPVYRVYGEGEFEDGVPLVDGGRSADRARPIEGARIEGRTPSPPGARPQAGFAPAKWDRGPFLRTILPVLLAIVVLVGAIVALALRSAGRPALTVQAQSPPPARSATRERRAPIARRVAIGRPRLRRHERRAAVTVPRVVAPSPGGSSLGAPSEATAAGLHRGEEFGFER